MARPPAALTRLLDLGLRRPLSVLAVTVLTVALSLVLAARLELRTGLGDLLPEGRESVEVAAAVAERLPTTSTLAIVAEGDDPEALAAWLEGAVARLEVLDSPLIGRVEAGRGDAAAFVARHALLYAALSDLEEARDAARERFAFEIHERAGMLLSEEREPWTTTITGTLPDHADGVDASRYLDRERGVAAVLVRTPVGAGDLERTAALGALIREAVGPPPPGIALSIGGDLATAAETYAQIRDDLRHVGAAGVALVLAVVLIFFRRLRPVIAMVVTIAVGASWTFAAAYLLVGHLNTATGFLFSIVVGNGINFSIIFAARYLNARREHEVEASLRDALARAWLPTLVAAGAASAAYGSLAVTEFRGFRHFGVIGGAGMLLCWLATFVVTPPMLVLFERHRPLAERVHRANLGRADVARLASSTPGASPKGSSRAPRALGRAVAIPILHPRTTLALAALIAVGAAFLAGHYLADPLEYDLRRIDNRPADVPSEARRLAPILDALVGRQGQDGVAIAVDDVAQVAPLVAALERRRAEAPEPPFSRVVTAFDLLPDRQRDKLAVIAELREVFERARRHGMVPPAEEARLASLFALPDRPIGLDDLPESLARPFTERDGTRGRLVYVVPVEGESVWDGRYLVRWSASFRRVVLPDGSVVRGSGRSVVFADLLQAIAEEAPKAIATSFLLTLSLLAFAFRGREALFVMLSVVLGLTLLLASLSFLGTSLVAPFAIAPLRLNFLDFVALPLTIGIGADYAVNVARGLDPRRAEASLRETGGAVVACSLTTILGYGALTLSVNGAIHSFGLAASAGEVACLFTALVVLPALLSRRWRPKAG
jgi:uncharacterized protein